MQKRIFGIMLAAVFLLPIIGGIVPVSGAGSDEPLYSISFDYELASSSALFKLCFNRYNGADTNNYLSWQFAENSVWPQRRGRSSVLSAYSFRNLGGGGTPFDGSAFEGPINVKIDVFSTYIETYVNGTLLRTDTFTDINTQNAYGASISAISTTVGLISTSANGTAYIDNLVVINGGASPSMKYYADFESENPFDGVGTSLEDGWLRIANISGGTSDSTVRWINEALATPPPGGVLQFYYDLYCKLNLNDYKSWSIAQFEDAMALAKNVIENSSSTQQEQNDAVAALIAAHGLLYGKNDVLNLRNYDQFRQDGTYNVALGKDVTVNSSTDIAVVPDYYYDFTKSADVAKFSVKNACTFVYNSDSGAFGRFTATGSDAYMLYSIPANEQFSADDYPYIAISQKNNSDKTSGDIFFGTTVNPGPAGPDRTSYPISAHDTDYVKIIIYMPEQNMGYSDEPQYQWTGFVNAFRMNVLSQGAANGDTCDLKYVAFFKTYEDAVAFDGVFPLASQPSNDPKVLANGLVGGNASNTWQITEDECVATVDLGAEYQIESVALFPRQDSGVTVNSALGFPLSYTIDFSTDGTTYFGAINEAGKTAATVKANPQFSSLSSPITVRYVRINMNETQEGKDYFALSEIAVYGKGGFVDMGNRDLYIPSVVDGWNPAFPMQAMHPDDGSLLPLDITWVSGDESVITVDTNGHVTAVGFGTTTLTAYDNKFGITAVWTVNVLVGQDKTGITDRIIISAFFQPLLPPHGPGIDDEAYRMMAECGIDLIENCHSAGQTSYEQNRQIAELCAKYGMWLLVNDIPQPVVSNDEWILMNYSQQQLEEYVNKWMDVPGVGGFYLADEPPTTGPYSMANWGTLMAKIKLLTPNLILHMNERPDSSSGAANNTRGYINSMLAASGNQYLPDYIGDCEYPFQTGTNGRVIGSNDIKNTWFTYMNRFRQIGNEFGIKTLRYLQLDHPTASYPLCEKEQIRYELYSGLAYGIKRFGIFTWNMPQVGSGSWKGSVLQRDGTYRQPMYDDLKELLAQMHALSDIVYPLKSENVYFTGNTAALRYNQDAVPTSFLAQPADNTQKFIYSYMVNPENGTQYLMVVNNRMQSDAPNITHTINFTNAAGLNIARLREVSNVTGKYLEPMDLTETHSVTLEFLPGEGRLFRLDYVHDHEYEAKVTEPTCTEDGYTTYTCSICDDEYVADETSALGHDMVLVSTTLEGKLYECTRCDYFELIALTDWEYLQEIAADALSAGIEENTVQSGKTVKLVFDDREIVLSENANNVNISGEVYIGDGYWLIYDIKGNGKNVKAFEIIKREVEEIDEEIEETEEAEEIVEEAEELEETEEIVEETEEVEEVEEITEIAED